MFSQFFSLLSQVEPALPGWAGALAQAGSFAVLVYLVVYRLPISMQLLREERSELVRQFLEALERLATEHRAEQRETRQHHAHEAEALRALVLAVQQLAQATLDAAAAQADRHNQGGQGT